jgi:hypothetical protein
MPERSIPPHAMHRITRPTGAPSATGFQGGYDSIYLGLIPRLAGCNFEESANCLGLDYRAGHIQAQFLGRRYVITRDGVESLDGQPVDVNIRSVLLYYLLSKGSGNPEYAYVLFENFPRLVGGLGNPIGLMSTPLERKFGANYAAFREAAIRLGGKEENSQPGSHACQFDLLPKIAARLVFQEADEDFSARIQIMLDQAALGFLDFECLAVMVGCFVGALIRAV